MTVLSPNSSCFYAEKTYVLTFFCEDIVAADNFERWFFRHSLLRHPATAAQMRHETQRAR